MRTCARLDTLHAPRFAPTLAVLTLSALLAGCAGAGGTGSATPNADAAPSERAVRLAREQVIVDTHIDVPYRLKEAPADVGLATADGDFDYPRAVAGGLDAPFMSIYIPADVDAAGGAVALADELIDGVEALIAAHPDKFMAAACPRDITAAVAAGRIALPLGLENGAPIAGDLARLDHLRAHGVAYVTLTHSKSNHISDSSYEPSGQHGGLSAFGRTLVPAMQDRGMMVDVSHVSDQAFWQVVELARTPIIASHSSLRNFTPGFERNLTDNMVRAIARTGGVVQIAIGSGFLTAEARAWSTRQQAAAKDWSAGATLAADDPKVLAWAAEWRKDNPYPYATIDDVLDHIDRAVALAGIDHVGIGSDYDGVGDSLPIGLKDVSTFPALIDGLLRRGYDEQAISQILGGNVLRVWNAVVDYGAAAGYAPVCRT
ncbi:MAG: dipeptidase [Gammaproteobacteria bacterium]